MSTIGHQFQLRRVSPVLWVIGLGAVALVAFQPATTGISKCCFLALLFGGLITSLWLLRRHRKTCLTIAALVIGSVITLTCFSWSIRTQPADLRKAYIKHLLTYEGCNYYWGGEWRGGIDCSGLMRRGMIDACMDLGISRLDLGLIQQAISWWWNDVSAEAMGKEYAGLTRKISEVPKLNTLDHHGLEPGIIAVTQGGHHVMAYIGEERWIEADPSEGKVIVVHAPSTANGWFRGPMRLLEWTLLSPR